MLITKKLYRLTNMGKVFRPSNRESSLLNKIESSKEHARRAAITSVKNNAEHLANNITMKLIEEGLVETTSKNLMEIQVLKCLNQLWKANNFDIDYQISPIRNLVDRPNIVSLYITMFVLETLLNHKITVDVYGTDNDIYMCIDKEVNAQP